MKKFSLKFMLFATLCLFSSFVYADGVFSKYYGSNGDIGFSVNVPITKYEQPTPDGSEIIDLQFLKNSFVGIDLEFLTKSNLLVSPPPFSYFSTGTSIEK